MHISHQYPDAFYVGRESVRARWYGGHHSYITQLYTYAFSSFLVTVLTSVNTTEEFAYDSQWLRKTKRRKKIDSSSSLLRDTRQEKRKTSVLLLLRIVPHTKNKFNTFKPICPPHTKTNAEYVLEYSQLYCQCLGLGSRTRRKICFFAKCMPVKFHVRLASGH